MTVWMKPSAELAALASNGKNNIPMPNTAPPSTLKYARRDRTCLGAAPVRLREKLTNAGILITSLPHADRCDLAADQEENQNRTACPITLQRSCGARELLANSSP